MLVLRFGGVVQLELNSPPRRSGTGCWWCGGSDGRDGHRGVRQGDAVDLEAAGDWSCRQVALAEVHVHERAFRARHVAERRAGPVTVKSLVCCRSGPSR